MLKGREPIPSRFEYEYANIIGNFDSVVLYMNTVARDYGWRLVSAQFDGRTSHIVMIRERIFE